MIHVVAKFTIPAALSLLPPAMDTPQARAMLLAIGLQESRFLHRRQTNYGPARGFWQFEKAGVRGVVKHKASAGHAADVLRLLRYEELVTPAEFQIANIHNAIEDNDVLACVFARLLLYTLPSRLPDAHETGLAWNRYVDAWRPGKPHAETWEAFYDEAWTRVVNDGWQNINKG